MGGHLARAHLLASVRTLLKCFVRIDAYGLRFCVQEERKIESALYFRQYEDAFKFVADLAGNYWDEGNYGALILK